MSKNIIKAILICSLFTITCNKKENVEKEGAKVEQSDGEENLQSPDNDSLMRGVGIIQKFDLPGEISGCNSKFAATKEDFEKGKFIYADDYGNTAYIMIAGKMIKIQMEEGDFDPSEIDRSIENDQYKITLQGKKLKQEGETSTFEGKIKILKKEGTTSESSIYGETGC